MCVPELCFKILKHLWQDGGKQAGKMVQLRVRYCAVVDSKVTSVGDITTFWKHGVRSLLASN